MVLALCRSSCNKKTEYETQYLQTPKNDPLQKEGQQCPSALLDQSSKKLYTTYKINA